MAHFELRTERLWLRPCAPADVPATEASRALAEYGFRELGMTRVLASTDGPNAASVRVMERLGMRFERRTPDGHFGETLFYALERP